MEIKSFTKKLGSGIVSGVKSGAQAVEKKVKQGYEGIKNKVEEGKLKKSKDEYLIGEFRKSAIPFCIHFKNSKSTNVRGIYYFEDKILEVYYEGKIDKENIDFISTQSNQKYYVEEIDENGSFFTCEYEEETLKLKLKRFRVDTKKPITQTVNNINITDNSIHNDNSVKAKNSNVNSNGASTSTNVDLGINIK